MSRPASQTSAVTTTAPTAPSRSVSVKTTTKTGRVDNPLPPSDIRLFVTNLRLLDFDRREDWPGITVQTFSSRNADQKQRIGATEWSLFRLFEIWDPVEASQKLRPFFPPLEPLQSRNLRIALHRSLDALKKDGVLGREAVLRKTMLDECKGEKFFEILALFSNAVLKKVLASKRADKRRTAVSRKWATATTLTSTTQDSLLPLAIAHKAALANVLRRKEEKRTRFIEFESLLNAKTDSINQRIRKCKETPRAQRPPIPQKESAAIKKQLEDNWIGDQKWLDVMLHGEHVQAEDAFLNSSFPQVWRTVEKGRKLEDAVPDMGLMESLQLRVQEQQSRLQTWKRFHASLQKDKSAEASASTKTTRSTKEFKFDQHLQLQLGTGIPDSELVQKTSLHSDLADILSEMEEELSRVAEAKHNHSSMPQLRRQSSSLSSRSPVRRRKSRSDSISKPQPSSPPRQMKPAPPLKSSRETISHRLSQRRVPSITNPMDSEATLVGQSSAPNTTVTASRSIDSLPELQHSPESIQEISPIPAVKPPPPTQRVVEPSPSTSPSPSPPPPLSYLTSEPPTLHLPAISSEEALAAQIISTIGDATPSPIKKQPLQLSLAERTRLSMAQTLSFSPIAETSSPPSPQLPQLPEEPSPIAPFPALPRQQSLLERTQQTMAAMNSNPTHPRVSLAPPKEDTKSTRHTSTFPVNQFDTPRTARKKSFEILDEPSAGEKTPKEDLFSDEVDYDRVFKSRPRIATSPVFGTPALDADFDEGVTGVDLADVDRDSDDAENAWENSPSKVKGGVRVLY